MAGVIKSHLQLGDSNTATQNFMLTAQNADGTMKIARGINGATTQDILTVDALGVVRTPASPVPCFSAYQSVTQSFAANTWTKLFFQAEEFDLTNAFDSVTNYRFQPTIAGYYYMTGNFQVNSVVNSMQIAIYKNGTPFKYSTYVVTNAAGLGITSLIFLNGSSDYLELWGFASTAQGIVNSSAYTYFQGVLVQRV